MTYVIHFFTSEETNDVGCGLESSKLSTSQLSDFELVRVIKKFVGNDEHLPDSTYVLPIIEQWKQPFLATMEKWAVLCPKLNEVITLVSKLKEGRYLGVSFNEPIEYAKKKEILFKMQELERGIPAKQKFDEFMNQNGSWMQIYKPFCYVPNERIRFGVQERFMRVCRYCGKRMPETTFKKDAHTISKSLGNIQFITNDECDKCNKHFGAGIEQEFVNYISIYRTLAARYEGHPYFTTHTTSFRLAVDEDTNKIRFDILDKSKARIESSDKQIDIYADGGYINYHNVYRALVKFVIGMLPDEQLPFFKDTIKWINGKDNLSQLPIVKETIYPEPEQHPFINLFFRKNESNVYPYLVAEFHFNHLEFVYVVPGCQLDKFEIKDNILDDFLKLRKDNNRWRNLEMHRLQPTHMKLHASFYMKKNNEPRDK